MAASRPASLPIPPNPNGVPCSAVRNVNATHPPNSPAPIPLARSAGNRREATPATITPPTATTTGIIATRSRNGSAGPSVAAAKATGRQTTQVISAASDGFSPRRRPPAPFPADSGSRESAWYSPPTFCMILSVGGPSSRQAGARGCGYPFRGGCRTAST